MLIFFCSFFPIICLASRTAVSPDLDGWMGVRRTHAYFICTEFIYLLRISSASHTSKILTACRQTNTPTHNTMVPTFCFVHWLSCRVLRERARHRQAKVVTDRSHTPSQRTIATGYIHKSRFLVFFAAIACFCREQYRFATLVTTAAAAVKSTTTFVGEKQWRHILIS